MKTEILLLGACLILGCDGSTPVSTETRDAGTSVVRPAPPLYRIRDLGFAIATATAINDDLQIVGYYADATGSHAFRRLWSGKIDSLAPLHPGDATEARDISTTGLVVGRSYALGIQEAVFWTTPSHVVGLGTLGGIGSDAEGVNSAGNIVGIARTAGGQDHAFFRDSRTGVMQDIGTFGGAWSDAHEISADNVVAGCADDGAGGVLAFLWSPAGGLLDHWPSACAWGINNHSTAAGNVWPSYYAVAAVFPTHHAPILFGGVTTKFNDINDADLAVGTCSGPAHYLACYAAPGGAMTNLTGLRGGTDNEIAEGVNRDGYIVGTSASRAVFWYP